MLRGQSGLVGLVGLVGLDWLVTGVLSTSLGIPLSKRFLEGLGVDGLGRGPAGMPRQTGRARVRVAVRGGPDDGSGRVGLAGPGGAGLPLAGGFELVVATAGWVEIADAARARSFEGLEVVEIAVSGGSVAVGEGAGGEDRGDQVGEGSGGAVAGGVVRGVILVEDAPLPVVGRRALPWFVARGVFSWSVGWSASA
jgi:hypothetical protein